MSQAKRKSNGHRSLSDAEAEAARILKRFSMSPPEISTAQMYDIEKHAQAMDRSRRLAFGVLTKSGPELLRIAKESPKEAAEMSVTLSNYLKSLSDLRSLIQTAEWRVSLALCERPDMKELLKRAESELVPMSAADEPAHAGAPS